MFASTARRQFTAALGRPAIRFRHYADYVSQPQVTQDWKRLPKPDSANFFSGRGRFHDTIHALESSLKIGRAVLTSQQLYPLPDSVMANLPTPRSAWKPAGEMEDFAGMRLRTSQYRRMTAILQEIKQLRTIAAAAGRTDLEAKLAAYLSEFEREGADKLGGRRKPVPIDEVGRSYALGRRKESSARVWMIPVKQSAEAGTDAATAQAAVPTTQVIVNNAPLATYFPLSIDRERVMRPLKVAGVVGQFNVFAIARGGGTTGQSEAIALGMAKCLTAHELDLKHLLRKANALRRDPRMVERKKTGWAKARKKYQWVKR